MTDLQTRTKALLSDIEAAGFNRGVANVQSFASEAADAMERQPPEANKSDARNRRIHVRALRGFASVIPMLMLKSSDKAHEP